MKTSDLGIFENLPCELIEDICFKYHKSKQDFINQEIIQTNILSEKKEYLSEFLVCRYGEDDEIEDIGEFMISMFYYFLKDHNIALSKKNNIITINRFLKYMYELYVYKLNSKMHYLYDIDHIEESDAIKDFLENIDDLYEHYYDIEYCDYDIDVWNSNCEYNSKELLYCA